MLSTLVLTLDHSWRSVIVWLARRLAPAPPPVYGDVARPDLAARRFPIPPERAHLYARAADE